MFVNFVIKEDEELYLGTLNVANLIMVGFEKEEWPTAGGVSQMVYRLTLHFNDIGHYCLIETTDHERLQLVHSAFCSVLAGGDIAYLDGIGFIEPIYPPEAGTLRTPNAPKEESRRTLNDI